MDEIEKKEQNADGRELDAMIGSMLGNKKPSNPKKDVRNKKDSSPENNAETAVNVPEKTDPLVIIDTEENKPKKSKAAEKREKALKAFEAAVYPDGSPDEIEYSGAYAESDDNPDDGGSEEYTPELSGTDENTEPPADDLTDDPVLPVITGNDSQDEDETSEDEPVSAPENEEDENAEYDEEYEDDFDYSEMYRELEKSRRKKRKKKNKGKLAFGLIFTTLIICISVGIAIFIMRAVRAITGIDRDDTQIVIDIPENSTASDIAAILYNEGIIGDEKLFIFFSRIRHADSSYVAGSHLLSPNMPYDTILEILQKSEETEERESADVTFPEGITLWEAAAKLEENGICPADRFIYIFNSSSFGFDFEEKVENDPMKFCKMEGYFFPDTYSFYLEEEPEVVAKKIYRNFENKLTPDYYGRMNDLGMTLDETITLASMVQAEGNNFNDMKLISSVFHNRLKSKDFPKLQSDPTRKYVENTIKPNIEVPNEKMYTAYDTYKGEGLPPGPICNPGIDAIKAALYPAETNYFYFCADIDTGEVFYAETLEEHEENLRTAGIIKSPPTTKAADKASDADTDQ